MTTATFYVNQSNTSPAVIQIVGPPADSIVRNGSYRLFWYPTTDVDTGDYVVDYHLQIATSTDFLNVVVDDSSVVLGEVPSD